MVLHRSLKDNVGCESDLPQNWFVLTRACPCTAMYLTSEKGFG